MKTIKRWLKEGLSEEDYEKAKEYKNEKWKEERDCFGDALNRAFIWEYTQEGGRYWQSIFDNGGSIDTDPIVEAVCKDLRKRSELGIKKYGTTLKDANLTEIDLLQHAYEEALDLANYLKTLIIEQPNNERIPKN